MKHALHEIDSIHEMFTQAPKEVSLALIERDDEVDLVLTALIAYEPVLLVVPPGCGKKSWVGFCGREPG